MGKSGSADGIGVGEDVGYPKSLLLLDYKYLCCGGGWCVEVISFHS